MGIKLSEEDVINRAISVHGNKYDYSKFKYIHALEKSCIICIKHGEFWQTPAKHINLKQNCPKCSKEQSPLSHRINRSSRKLIGIEQPTDYKIIPLSKGFQTKVSNCDFDIVCDKTWKVNVAGYACSTKYGAMHRYIMGNPSDKLVDHVNGDRLDNRRENLRLVSNLENAWNSKPYKNSTSKYKGVCWNKRMGKWVTQIVFKGKLVYSKSFISEDEAGKAYNKEIIKYHREFAKLNNINDNT